MSAPAPWFRLSSIVRPPAPAPAPKPVPEPAPAPKPVPEPAPTGHWFRLGSFNRPPLPLSPSRNALQQPQSSKRNVSPPNVERPSLEDSRENATTKERGQEHPSTAKTEEALATAKTEQSTNVKKEQVKMVLSEEQIRAIFKKFAKGEKVLRKKDLKKAFYHFGFFFPQFGPINISDANKDGFVKLKDLDALVDNAIKHGYTVQ